MIDNEQLTEEEYWKHPLHFDIEDDEWATPSTSQKATQIICNISRRWVCVLLRYVVTHDAKHEGFAWVVSSNRKRL